MAKGFKAFSSDRYIQLKYTNERKTTIGMGTNRQTVLSKGMKFGLRPATSQKGMFRIIIAGKSLTQVHSVNAKFANLILQRSVAIN